MTEVNEQWQAGGDLAESEFRSSGVQEKFFLGGWAVYTAGIYTADIGEQVMKRSGRREEKPRETRKRHTRVGKTLETILTTANRQHHHVTLSPHASLSA